MSADRLTVVAYPGVIADEATASDLLDRAATRRGLSVTMRISLGRRDCGRLGSGFL